MTGGISPTAGAVMAGKLMVCGSSLAKFQRATTVFLLSLIHI